jgi:hypothetical protein
MSTESTNGQPAEKTVTAESAATPVNTAAPMNKINWRQAAATAGAVGFLGAIVAGGVYAYGKIKS